MTELLKQKTAAPKAAEPLKNTRDLSLDITRIFAFASVPAVHFFLNSGFYETPVTGKRMFILIIMRGFFMCCVPLFILLSGYLMSGKEVKPEKKSILHFYSKLSKVIIVYLLSTIVILLFRTLHQHETLTIRECVLNIFGYQQYAWYVNMYIGLFLLIPFLNMLWNAIGTKQGHLILVICLCVITVTPGMFNIYDFLTPGALLHPWTATDYNQLVPNWWSSIYPITYYFIGAYLKSHVDIKKLKTWVIFLLLALSVTSFGLFNIWKNYSVNFLWGVWCDFGSFQSTINAVLVFLLINSINMPGKHKRVAKVVKLISELTFGAYLLSYIPDNIFYPKLAEAVPDMNMRLEYFPLIVGAVILVSLLLSLIVHLLNTLIHKIKVHCSNH